MSHRTVIRPFFNPPLSCATQTHQAFAEWLELAGLRFTAVPNNTYSPYMNQKMKNRRLGLRRGFPDLVVLVPPSMPKDGHGHLLGIEMKRIRDSKTSPDQAARIKALNGLQSPDVEALVCKGAEQAIWAVCKHIHPATNISPF